MISCSEAVRQLWEFLENELPESDRAKVDEHLGACLRCCGEAEFAGELREFIAERGKDESLPPEVRTALLSTLDSIMEAP
ncbi:MAG: zf-HC2 domain-containing protein [Actinomycetota bacterium]|jgi:anti-sigma factor (TIGR02949 family)